MTFITPPEQKINPKFEYRNPKQTQNSNFPIPKRLRFLQRLFTPPFRRKPESRILESRLWRDWIPGCASLARNDDFPLLAGFLQEPRLF
jgi:hypothetical protein